MVIKSFVLNLNDALMNCNNNKNTNLNNVKNKTYKLLENSLLQYVSNFNKIYDKWVEINPEAKYYNLSANFLVDIINTMKTFDPNKLQVEVNTLYTKFNNELFPNVVNTLGKDILNNVFSNTSCYDVPTVFPINSVKYSFIDKQNRGINKTSTRTKTLVERFDEIGENFKSKTEYEISVLNTQNNNDTSISYYQRTCKYAKKRFDKMQLKRTKLI